MIKLRQPETTNPNAKTGQDSKTSSTDSMGKDGGRSNVKIRTFTLEEIAKHNTADDLWMIIHNKVYNITSIIDQHPGGAEVLFDFAGADGSVPFDDVGHSQDSVEMLRPLFLGIVAKNVSAGTSDIELRGGSAVIIMNDKDEILMKIDEDFDEELPPGIRYYNVLGAESEKNNSSLGQSTYWKRYLKEKRLQKKKRRFNYCGITEKNINMVLLVVAVFSFIGLIWLEKQRWRDHYYHPDLYEHL